MNAHSRDELDRMTCGEVALLVFGAESVLSEAAEVRAEACRRLAEAQNAVEAANEKVNSAATVERYCSNEYKALKKYLNDRLGYK